MGFLELLSDFVSIMLTFFVFMGDLEIALVVLFWILGLLTHRLVYLKFGIQHFHSEEVGVPLLEC